MQEQVVITAMGAVSPVGSHLDTIWENVVHGRSGIQKLNHIPIENLRSQICGYAVGYDDFEVDKYLRKSDPCIRYAV